MTTAHELPSSGKRPSIKLTDALVRALELPPGKTDYTYFDTDVPGFGVRCRAAGSKRFVFVYKNGKRVQIGVVTAHTVREARQTAAGYYAKVLAGGDPAGEKAAAKEKADAETPLTFLALAKRYLEQKQPRMRPASYAALVRYLDGHCKPLHGRPADAITLREVAACIDTVDLKGHKRNGDAARKNLRSALSGVFTYGMQRGLITTNPVTGLPPYTVRSRERVLSLPELRHVWLAAGDDDFGTIVRLLILTGQRRMEIGGLRRSELQGDGIIIPSARTKNHREHHVPLPPLAQSLIAEQLARQPADRRYVFGRRNQRPYGNWGKGKAALDRAIAAQRGEPLAAWTLHDLRRSFATHVNELSIAQPHIVEALLNHVSGHKGGVAGTYNRALYATEKRTALNRWAEFLVTLIDGRQSNVVTMRGA